MHWLEISPGWVNASKLTRVHPHFPAPERPTPQPFSFVRPWLFKPSPSFLFLCHTLFLLSVFPLQWVDWTETLQNSQLGNVFSSDPPLSEFWSQIFLFLCNKKNVPLLTVSLTSSSAPCLLVFYSRLRDVSLRLWTSHSNVHHHHITCLKFANTVKVYKDASGF